MIKTLSPYYVTIPWLSPLTSLTATQYTIELYIWNGSKDVIPAEPSYQITKTNPEALVGDDKIEISRLVNSFITFTPTLGVVNNITSGDNQLWVKQSVFYTTSNPTEATTPQLESTIIALKGWGYGIGGENQDVPTDKVLMQGREFKVSQNSKFIVPIRIDETVVPTGSIGITDVTLDTGNDYIITFNIVGTYTLLTCRIFPLVGDPYLELVDGVTSTQTVTIQPTTGLTGFQLFGYDSSSGQNIFSNIFEITI